MEVKAFAIIPHSDKKGVSVSMEVRPIVLCKDCKHRDPEDMKCDCSGMEGLILPRPDTWFCAYGEPKEGS